MKKILLLVLALCLILMMIGYWQLQRPTEEVAEIKSETTIPKFIATPLATPLATPTASSALTLEKRVREIFLQGQDPAVQVNLQWQRTTKLGEEYLVQFSSPSGPTALRALVQRTTGKVLRTWAGSHRKEGIPGDEHNHHDHSARKLEISGVL